MVLRSWLTKPICCHSWEKNWWLFSIFDLCWRNEVSNLRSRQFAKVEPFCELYKADVDINTESSPLYWHIPNLWNTRMLYFQIVSFKKWKFLNCWGTKLIIMIWFICMSPLRAHQSHTEKCCKDLNQFEATQTKKFCGLARNDVGWNMEKSWLDKKFVKINTQHSYGS